MPQTEYIKSGFTMVPNKVLLDTALSAKALRVFEMLEHHSGEHRVCWPGYALLADEVGCSVRWLPVIIDELVNAGYVHVHYREGKTNQYTLLVRVERQPKPTPVVGAGVPMKSHEHEQKQPTITNENRASRRLIQNQKPQKPQAGPIHFDKYTKPGGSCYRADLITSFT